MRVPDLESLIQEVSDNSTASSRYRAIHKELVLDFQGVSLITSDDIYNYFSSHTTEDLDQTRLFWTLRNAYLQLGYVISSTILNGKSKAHFYITGLLAAIDALERTETYR